MQQKPGITFSPVNQLSMAEGHSKVHESPQLQALPAIVMTSVFFPSSIAQLLTSLQILLCLPTKSAILSFQTASATMIESRNCFKVVLISRITILPESLRERPWGFEEQISEEKFPGNKTVF